MSAAQIQSLSFQYFSTSKFVEAIREYGKLNKLPRKLEKHECITLAHVWYKGYDTYQGNYDDINIRKPIYMKLLTSRNREIFITHEQILKLFEAKPIICIKQNFHRTVPQGKYRALMYLAIFDFEPRETSEGFRYDPVDIVKEDSPTRIKVIEKQVIDLSQNTNQIESSDSSDSGTV